MRHGRRAGRRHGGSLVSALTRVFGAAAVAAAAAATAAASHATLTVHRSDASMLRVALSARPERVESCRTLSDEELAELPQHMRQRVVCDGVTARYDFQVLRDGALLARAEIRGGGLRHDRQLYVFRELPLPPGRALLEVRLTRVETDTPEPDDADHAGADEARAGRAGRAGGEDGRESLATDGRDQREADEHRRRVEDEIPASLLFRETVTIQPREVVLVTYDRDSRRLLLVRDSTAQAHVPSEVSDAGQRTYPR